MNNITLHKIKGIIPPMLTPFLKDGSLHEEGLRELVRFLRDKVDGLFVLGSYGSGLVSTVNTRKRAAEIIVEEVDGKIPVILHIGDVNFGNVLELLEHANSLNVEAVASVAPFYYDYNETQVYQFFEELIKKSVHPVMAYNNPKTTGFTMTVSLLTKLADIGLAGLKDASMDITFLYAMMNATKDKDFICVQGAINLGLPSFVAGCPAVMSSMANSLPELSGKLYDAVKGGNWEKARETQQFIDRVKKITSVGPSLSVAHALVKMRGIDSGVPKFPNIELEEKDYQNLEKALKDIGIL